MGMLFGTDGIRGIANEYPMTPEIALRAGRACAYLFKNEGKKHKILVGKDTRISGYIIESAITAGICSMGVDCVLTGPIPTPGIAFLTQSIRADAGIVISASHNPFYDNGIKIFGRDGFKLSDEMEEKIESLILSDEIDSIRPTHDKLGKAYRIDDASGRYLSYLKTIFPKDLVLDGIKIVLDCANGAFYKIAPRVFEELGAEVVAVGVEPDGENINKYCGALHPEHLTKHILEERADLGFALDGDGDRVIFADEKGNILDGDKILAILAKYMMKEDRLKDKTLVATHMSNKALEDFMKEMGGKLIRVDVGDRYVVECMRKNNFNLGGEQSGHIIMMDYTTTGDGVVAGLNILATILKEGKPISSFSNILEPYPQKLFNIKVREKRDYNSIPEIKKAIESAEKEIEERGGRVFIRYSGTEPKLRVMIESRDNNIIYKWESELKGVFEKYLGVQNG
ncbi:MAG: phosphoglucosamine mutase [Proteobacteria bacterium]|nr:phosphoglucosamine mutase [Pseudomonadota bacterium]